MTTSTTRGRSGSVRATARVRWLCVAMLAGGCDDESSEPPEDPGSLEESDTEAEPEPPEQPAQDDGESQPDDGETPTFVTDVLPILQAACSCHRAGPEAGVDLGDEAAYETLVFGQAAVGMALVEPGDPDASYVVLKLRGEQASVGGGGSRMPIGTPLDDAKMRVIEGWIAAGASEE